MWMWRAKREEPNETDRAVAVSLEGKSGGTKRRCEGRWSGVEVGMFALGKESCRLTNPRGMPALLLVASVPRESSRH